MADWLWVFIHSECLSEQHHEGTLSVVCMKTVNSFDKQGEERYSGLSNCEAGWREEIDCAQESSVQL